MFLEAMTNVVYILCLVIHFSGVVIEMGPMVVAGLASALVKGKGTRKSLD